MKSVVKFLSVVFLFLSTSLSAQNYKVYVDCDSLFVKSVGTSKGVDVIQTKGSVNYELYKVSSKQVLGIENLPITDTMFAKYMNMNDGDKLIADRLKFDYDSKDCVEFFYYSETFITNYFTPQKLDNSDYVLKIKDDKKTITLNIKNGEIKKETL
jgi:hypothetical protein